jgi:replicative DNA helicase
LNPWNGQRVADGLRVLFIDGENSRPQTRRAYRWMIPRIHRPVIAPGWNDRIFHKSVRPGVDLARKDNAWFRETAEQHSPDVVILSPAYKLMRGCDPKDDGDVMAFLDAVDTVMVQHDCSVLIESHAPYGAGAHGREMRPFGSARWLAWPEIGIGYHKDPDDPDIDPKTGRARRVVGIDFRGAREDRDWPSTLSWGSFKQPPWVPEYGWVPSVDVGYEIGEAG